MKTSIVLGVGLLVLSAALVLRKAASDSAFEDTPNSAQSEQPTKTGGSHPVKVRTAVSPQSGPPLCANLLAAIEAETDPERRSEALEHAVESVPNSEMSGLLDSLAKFESPTAVELRELLIRHWAETDGPAVAVWVSQIGQNPTYQQALTQVALGWAMTDLSAALDWARRLPEGDSRATVTLALGYETARTDAVKALEVAASLEPTRQRDNLIEHVISQWATTDLDAAVRWANENVSDPNLRQRVLAAVTVAAAERDGAAAATLAATALDPGVEQDRVAVAIVQRWAQNEPEMAASWVAQFADTSARETTIQNLITSWAAQNRAAAGNWLQTLPAGTLRNVGMAAYAQVRPLAAEVPATE